MTVQTTQQGLFVQKKKSHLTVTVSESVCAPLPDDPKALKSAARFALGTETPESVERLWHALTDELRILDLPVVGDESTDRALVEIYNDEDSSLISGVLLKHNGELQLYGGAHHYRPPSFLVSGESRPKPVDPRPRHGLAVTKEFLFDRDNIWTHTFSVSQAVGRALAIFIDSGQHKGILRRGRIEALRQLLEPAGVDLDALLTIAQSLSSLGQSQHQQFLSRLNQDALRLSSTFGTCVLDLYNLMRPTGDPATERQALFLRQAVEQYPCIPALIMSPAELQPSSDRDEFVHSVRAGDSVKESFIRYLGTNDPDVAAWMERLARRRPMSQFGDIGVENYGFGNALEAFAHARRIPQSRDDAKRLIEARPFASDPQASPFQDALLVQMRNPHLRIPAAATLTQIKDFQNWLARQMKLCRAHPARQPIVNALHGKGLGWWIEASNRWHATVTIRLAQEKPLVPSNGWRPLLKSSISASDHVFTEIVTAEALREAGKRMQHCVGSYSAACTANQCRILTISDPTGKEVATLEIRMEQGRLRSAQITGPSNRPVMCDLEDAAKSLVDRLNGGLEPALDPFTYSLMQGPQHTDDLPPALAIPDASELLKSMRDVLPVSTIRLNTLLTQGRAQALKELSGMTM